MTTRFSAECYYHSLADGTEAIAGWGIWDHALGDWAMDDGFATMEEAAEAAKDVNDAGPDYGHELDRLYKERGPKWASTPHGSKIGQAKCLYCEVP
jgi:hypothetical protein